jgi:hypothetical protein
VPVLRDTLFQPSEHSALSATNACRTGGAGLVVVNLGLTVADTQLLLGHSETTLRLWLTRAGSHAEKVQAHFFHPLHLGHLQLDELFTTLRNKAQTSECGSPLIL